MDSDFEGNFGITKSIRDKTVKILIKPKLFISRKGISLGLINLQILVEN